MGRLQATTTLVAALASCFVPAIASPIARRSDLIVKDFHQAPPAWANIGAPPTEHMLHLSIGLTQSRFSELERHLYEGKIGGPEASNGAGTNGISSIGS
jgi:tripeptidyl-peptidase I